MNYILCIKKGDRDHKEALADKVIKKKEDPSLTLPTAPHLLSCRYEASNPYGLP